MAQPWGVKLEQARWSFAVISPSLSTRPTLPGRSTRPLGLQHTRSLQVRQSRRRVRFRVGQADQIANGSHALHARKHIGFRWFRRDP